MKNFEWLLVFCLGVIWGSSFLFAEILLQYLSHITIVFLRVFFSSCMLLIIILLTKTLIKLKSKDFVNLFIMGLLNNVIPFTFIIYGQQTTTGGMASIINSNTAFAAIIISAIFIPIEKLTISRTLGISIGILGVLIAIGFNNIFNLDSSLVGVSFVALATISYAFAGVWAKTKMSNLPPLIAATGMLLASSIILSPIIFLYYGDEFKLLNSKVILIALLFAFLCSVIAYLLYFEILKRTGVGNLLICTIIIPPSAIFFNSFILGEIIELKEIIGVIIITVGLLIVDSRVYKYIINKIKN